MNTLLELKCDLVELNSFAKKLAIKTSDEDIFLLRGELGVGKTTFARSFINSLFDHNKVERPGNIKSPSFPIMINYPLLEYEINHYDLSLLEFYLSQSCKSCLLYCRCNQYNQKDKSIKGSIKTIGTSMILVPAIYILVSVCAITRFGN